MSEINNPVDAKRGVGRPATGVATKAIRVPVDLIPAIEEAKRNGSNGLTLEKPLMDLSVNELLEVEILELKEKVLELEKDVQKLKSDKSRFGRIIKSLKKEVSPDKYQKAIEDERAFFLGEKKCTEIKTDVGTYALAEFVNYNPAPFDPRTTQDDDKKWNKK